MDSYFNVKAELLCYGIRVNSEAQKEMDAQNPFLEKRGGLSSGGFFDFDNGMSVTAPIRESYVKYSPFELVFEDKYWLYKNNERVCRLEPLKPPKWYYKDLSDGTPTPRILQQHSKNSLAIAAWSNCSLFSKGEQCKFCSIGLNKKAMEWKDPQLIKEAIAISMKENANYGLSMNGGMNYNNDRGSRLYLPALKAIREVSGLGIGMEMAPPKERKYLEEVYDAGATSLMMNFEAWDESMRRMLCPGKSRLGSRKDYFNAWRDSIEIFGEGMVSSVLIIGIESTESTEKGISALVDIGVIPDLVVLKPIDNTPLRNFPRACPENVKYLYTALGKKLREAGLNANKQPGCLQCGGCSLTSTVCKAY